MLRSFFLAIGISLCILGGECLIVDRAMVNLPGQGEDAPPGAYGATVDTSRREVAPPEWAPWTFISVGAVVTLYSLTQGRE